MSLLATQLPDDVFETITKNAGIILDDFDPVTWAVDRKNIKGATTGGIQFKDEPTYTDYGGDIDNCPTNMMELKQLDSRVVTATGTYVSTRATELKNLAAVADYDDDANKITPRNSLEQGDFAKAIWFVVDYGDDSAIAIRMDNVLNTSGFSLQTTNKGKGQYAFTYTAHYSMSEPDKVPYEIFIKDKKATE